MIFATVGHQMPFDRLVRLLDDWAARAGRSDVFAQIGRGEYQPRRFPSTAYLDPGEFERRIRGADAVVAHAGTGCIIKALYAGKPLLVLPRRARLLETRSDHQVATARRFAEAGQLLMAQDDADFVRQLGVLESFRPSAPVGHSASPALLSEIRRFLGA